MGIKGWLFIGAGALLTIAVLLGKNKEKDLYAEKVEQVIRDVDKKDHDDPATVEQMSDDVEKAFREMGLDAEAEAVKGAVEDLKDLKKNATDILNKTVTDDEDFLKEVETAKNSKNFRQLEDILEHKFNPYPYHQAPASTYSMAKSKGIIDEALYEEAAKYYGKLWFYSGD